MPLAGSVPACHGEEILVRASFSRKSVRPKMHPIVHAVTSSTAVAGTPCQIRHVRWTPLVLPCPRCGSAAPRVWDTARTAIDLDLDAPVLLRITVSVHHCPACPRRFRAQPPFLRPDAVYTNRVVAK